MYSYHILIKFLIQTLGIQINCCDEIDWISSEMHLNFWIRSKEIKFISKVVKRVKIYWLFDQIWLFPSFNWKLVKNRSNSNTIQYRHRILNRTNFANQFVVIQFWIVKDSIPNPFTSAQLCCIYLLLKWAGTERKMKSTKSSKMKAIFLYLTCLMLGRGTLAWSR